MDRALKATDRAFSAISKNLHFLKYITIKNEKEIEDEFLETGDIYVNDFRYEEPDYDPEKYKDIVIDAPVEDIKHTLLRILYREKRDELLHYLEMVQQRGTEKFLEQSLTVFGLPYDELHTTAKEILIACQDDSEGSSGEKIDAEAFKERAEEELKYYKEKCAEFNGKAEIDESGGGGIKNSDSTVKIGSKFTLSLERVEPLIQHEIGTHMITYFNAVHQPLDQVEYGFASYDELQEGLAIFAEYITGGLTNHRLRTIAARVVAAKSLLDDADFKATYKILHEKYCFKPKTAFSITSRAYRGGGFTKDISYLRGFMKVFSYLNSGRPLEPLFAGKFAIEHAPIIEKLLEENIIKKPMLLPRYLQFREAQEKLRDKTGTFSVLECAIKSKVIGSAHVPKVG
jgi:uncharacterized protein (TIGR02421 family)